MTSDRRQRLLARLPDKEVDALLVSAAENRRYLSGFTGSNGWLFVSPARTALVTDGRYWTQVETQCPGVELVKFKSQEDVRLSRRLGLWLGEIGFSGKVGVEGRNLTVAAFEEMREDLEDLPVELKPVDGLVEDLRQVKSAEEVEALRKAAEVADRAFRKALDSFRVGVREADFCAELEYQLQKCGARKPSFDSIVASGPNGAFPHAGVTERPIREGELVTVDFGALVDGYCSDMTRTVWIGDLDERSLEIYRTVRTAQRSAVEAVRPEVKGGEVDKVARDLIAEAGFGEAFNHGLGHGVGLAVHEGPALRAESEVVLKPGMVVTVEPGIYVPGVGGSRVEDLVVVTEGGAERLSRAPYQEPGQTHPLEGWS